MLVHFPLELEKECQASCRVHIGIGGFLSRCHSALTFAIVFQIDPWGDRRVNAGESGVSGVNWDIGAFGMVARPVEFLSSVKLRPLPLQVRRERQDSFPNEAGKWTFISRRGWKPGHFLNCGGTLGVPLEWRRVCRGTLQLPQGCHVPF